MASKTPISLAACLYVVCTNPVHTHARACHRTSLSIQGVAGALFFWTYMLLVFLVLLNFLLAIIVDAFSEVRRWPSNACTQALGA